jgi:hypothetical protein
MKEGIKKSSKEGGQIRSKKSDEQKDREVKGAKRQKWKEKEEIST